MPPDIVEVEEEDTEMGIGFQQVESLRERMSGDKSKNVVKQGSNIHPHLSSAIIWFSFWSSDCGAERPTFLAAIGELLQREGVHSALLSCPNARSLKRPVIVSAALLVVSAYPSLSLL
jgi:hypothetical protein